MNDGRLDANRPLSREAAEKAQRRRHAGVVGSKLSALLAALGRGPVTIEEELNHAINMCERVHGTAS